MRRVQQGFLLVFGGLLALSLLNAPGTEDFGAWLDWTHSVDKVGVVEGYRVQRWDYPPLTYVILFVVAKASHLLGIELFLGLKLSILFFLFLTLFTFWLWTKNLWLTALLQLALLLNSAALGYLDIYFAPTLILSLWALKKRNLLLFTLLFSTTCLIKWQPIIIVPFLLPYIVDSAPLKHWKDFSFRELIQTDFGKLLRLVLLPLLLISALVVLIWGFEPLRAFHLATLDPLLSGNALNFNWIMTHLLHLIYPTTFGGLSEGQGNYIEGIPSKSLEIIPKLLFFGAYTVVFLAYLRRERTFPNLLIYSLVGYLAYFTFNTGVHENHLFICLILSALLAWVDRRHLLTFALFTLVTNFNMFLFYGLDGTAPAFSRVIMGLDIALLFALFNIVWFLTFLIYSLTNREEALS